MNLIELEKIGGKPRELTIHQADVTGILPMVKAEMAGGRWVFKD